MRRDVSATACGERDHEALDVTYTVAPSGLTATPSAPSSAGIAVHAPEAPSRSASPVRADAAGLRDRPRLSFALEDRDRAEARRYAAATLASRHVDVRAVGRDRQRVRPDEALPWAAVLGFRGLLAGGDEAPVGPGQRSKARRAGRARGGWPGADARAAAVPARRARVR
jgi:hypothetical protein